MSEVNVPALRGPYRRKVTLACDSCRKRRVRCSGTHPCTSCTENEQQCVFDSTGRGRRGPRPRKSGTQLTRITHKLAPRQLSMAIINSKKPSDTGKPTVNETEAQTNDALESSEVSNIGQASEFDSVSMTETDTTFDSESWRPALEQLLKTLPLELDVDLACHLVELFCGRMHIQFGDLFPFVQITQSISDMTISQGLLLAMCASSFKFSMHKTVMNSHSKTSASLCANAARIHVHSSLLRQLEIDNIRTLCVLVDFETSRSCGRTAWVDIASGMSLVQLARLDHQMNPEVELVLESAARYLTIAELSHSIGRISFQPRVVPGANQHECSNIKFPEETNKILDLLGILVRIERQCSTEFKSRNPEPWGAESDFRKFQNELENHLIRDPSIFQMGHREYLPKHDVDSSLATLMWHCCAILLNRTFLPITERIKAQGDRQELKCIDFPGAPPLFLKERINRCEASANAICNVIMNLISHNGFFRHTLLIGYSCMQSALVLINRLHRSSKPYSRQLIENLKRLFIVLGAVKMFYSPAKMWIDTLFRIHDTTSPLSHASGDLAAAFDSYFDRFLDIEEPVFVPLDMFQEGVQLNTTTKQLELSRNGQNTNIQFSKPSTERMEWLRTYVDHLSGDAHEQDDADVHQPSNSPTYPGDDNNNKRGGGTEVGVRLNGSSIMDGEFLPSSCSMDLLDANNGGQSSLMDRVDIMFPDIFDQMPLVREFFAINPEMPVLTGVGQLMDGEDIWADIFDVGLFPNETAFQIE